MLRSQLALVLTAGLLVVTACSRPQPSADYEQARTTWTRLVQERGLDAADDPAADEVLALLDRVPPDSLDASAAADLRARIAEERKALAQERERRDRAVSAAAAPPPAPPAPSPAPERPAPAAGPSLAGMTVEAFRESYGACFEDGGDVQVAAPAGGPPAAARVWRMRDDPACRSAHARLADQLVVFQGGKLTALSPAASQRQVAVRRDVELAPLPDGGTGIVVDGRVAPVPADAKLRIIEAPRSAPPPTATPAASPPAAPTASPPAGPPAGGGAR